MYNDLQQHIMQQQTYIDIIDDNILSIHNSMCPMVTASWIQPNNMIDNVVYNKQNLYAWDWL